MAGSSGEAYAAGMNVNLLFGGEAQVYEGGRIGGNQRIRRMEHSGARWDDGAGRSMF
jgi:hypothetical protein